MRMCRYVLKRVAGRSISARRQERSGRVGSVSAPSPLPELALLLCPAPPPDCKHVNLKRGYSRLCTTSPRPPRPWETATWAERELTRSFRVAKGLRTKAHRQKCLHGATQRPVSTSAVIDDLSSESSATELARARERGAQSLRIQYSCQLRIQLTRRILLQLVHHVNLLQGSARAVAAPSAAVRVVAFRSCRAFYQFSLSTAPRKTCSSSSSGGAGEGKRVRCQLFEGE